MKNFLILFSFVLLSFTVQAQEIKWMSFNEAIAAQKKVAKPIFMDVYTDWCGPCKMLDKNTFSNPKLAEHINQNYYAVKFNAEGNEQIEFSGKTFSNPNFNPNRKGRNAMHQFTGYLRVPGYPSMVVLDEKGNIAKSIVGYRTADQLMSEI